MKIADFALNRLAVAALLCGAALAAGADTRETLGVPQGQSLPSQAQGNGPPSWAGKAFP
jgi:hypothetical protein